MTKLITPTFFNRCSVEDLHGMDETTGRRNVKFKGQDLQAQLRLSLKDVYQSKKYN